MPCRVDPTPAEEAASQKAWEERQQTALWERKELNKVTRLLCEIMTKIERQDKSDLSDELCDWWLGHTKKDKKRKKNVKSK